jgi:anti-sigma factor RsiW
MKCEGMEKRLIAYLDGRASPNERRQVTGHLATCSPCRARAEEFRALSAVLDELPAAEVSPAFDARLRLRIAAESSQKSWWMWFEPSARLAFAATLLLALSVWMASLPPSPSPNWTMAANTDAEFKMIKDLPVLEDYDVLSNFEALSELPPEPAPREQEM